MGTDELQPYFIRRAERFLSGLLNQNAPHVSRIEGTGIDYAKSAYQVAMDPEVDPALPSLPLRKVIKLRRRRMRLEARIRCPFHEPKIGRSLSCQKSPAIQAFRIHLIQGYSLLMRGSLLVLLFSLGCSSGYGQTPRYDIRQHFDRLYAGYGDTTPGVAVLIAEGDSILFAKGYGMANLEYGIPVDTATVFQVASVSKQFTAFAIYLLAADGLIDLNDEADQYLPELTHFAPAIRVDHLLSHTSGLKDHLALLTFAGWRMDEYVNNDQILRLVARQRELNFAPGSQFRYSNTNYVLLAEIIERVSGQSLNAFLQERVFRPLGMTRTQCYDDPRRLIPGRAYGYNYTDGRYEKESLHQGYVGSTGLFTTAADLAKWDSNFYDPVVGDAALIAAFNAAATLDDGATVYSDEQLGIRHAKGQFLRDYRGLTSFIHTGSDGGFRSFLGRWPAQRFTVILLSNDTRFAPYPNGFGFAEIYPGTGTGSLPGVHPGRGTCDGGHRRQIESSPRSGGHHRNLPQRGTGQHLRISL